MCSRKLDALYKAHPGDKHGKLKKEAIDAARRRADQEMKEGAIDRSAISDALGYAR